MGKSTLLKRWTAAADRAEVLVLEASEGALTPVEVMEAHARHLVNGPHELRALGRELHRLRELKAEVSKDGSAADLLNEVIEENADGIGDIVSLLTNPVAGAATKALAPTAARAALIVRQKAKGSRDLLLLEDPVGRLTDAYASDLNRLAGLAGSESLVLAFDGFEKTSASLAPWLASLANHSQLPSGILFLVAGQDRPDVALGKSVRDVVGTLLWSEEIIEFDREETQDCCASYGVTNPEVVDRIYEVTGGLALTVTTLAEARPERPEDVLDPSQSAADVYFNNVEPGLDLRVSRLVAAARVFNQDVVEVLLPEEDAGAVAAAFDKLKERPFVRKVLDGWAYHDTVRIQVGFYERTRSPTVWATAHADLAAHAETLENLGDWAYHLVSSDPVEGLTTVMKRGVSLLSLSGANDSELLTISLGLGQAASELRDADEVKEGQERLRSFIKRETALGRRARAQSIMEVRRTTDLPETDRLKAGVIEVIAWAEVGDTNRARSAIADLSLIASKSRGPRATAFLEALALRMDGDGDGLRRLVRQVMADGPPPATHTTALLRLLDPSKDSDLILEVVRGTKEDETLFRELRPWEIIGLLGMGEAEQARAVTTEFADQGDRFALLLRGQERLGAGDISEGLSDLRSAWAIAMGSDIVDILLQHGQTDQATAFAKTYVERDPDSPESRRLLAKALMEEGKLGEARSVLNVALRMSPGATDTLRMLALCAEREGDYIAARSFARQARAESETEYTVDDVWIRINRALNAPEVALAAIAEYESAMGHVPPSFEVERCLCLSYRGDLAAAVTHGRRLVEHERGEAPARRLANLYNCTVSATVGDLDGGDVLRDDLREVIRLVREEAENEGAGNLSNVEYAAAGLSAVEGDLDGAVEALRRSVEADSSVAIWAARDVAFRSLRYDDRFLNVLSGHLPKGVTV